MQFSVGQNSHNPKVGGHIEITVQPHHMYKYVYGVVSLSFTVLFF